MDSFPIDDDGEAIGTVESVLDRRFNEQGDLEYLLKWDDTPDPQWVPAGDLEDCDALIADWERRTGLAPTADMDVDPDASAPAWATLAPGEFLPTDEPLDFGGHPELEEQLSTRPKSSSPLKRTSSSPEKFAPRKQRKIIIESGDEQEGPSTTSRTHPNGTTNSDDALADSEDEPLRTTVTIRIPPRSPAKPKRRVSVKFLLPSDTIAEDEGSEYEAPAEDEEEVDEDGDSEIDSDDEKPLSHRSKPKVARKGKKGVVEDESEDEGVESDGKKKKKKKVRKRGKAKDGSESEDEEFEAPKKKGKGKGKARGTPKARKFKYPSHIPVCDKCGRATLNGRKKKNEDEDLEEDLGMLLHCKVCTISWHPGCYTALAKHYREALHAQEVKEKDVDGDVVMEEEGKEEEEKEKGEENKFLCPHCIKVKPCCAICEVKKGAETALGKEASVGKPVVEWADVSATPPIVVTPPVGATKSAGVEPMVVDSMPEKPVSSSAGLETVTSETAGSSEAGQNATAVGEMPLKAVTSAEPGATAEEDVMLIVEDAVVDGATGKEATLPATSVSEKKLPTPDPEPSNLFRCSRCYFLAHMSCLLKFYESYADSETEGFESGRGEKAMRDTWNCTDCLLWDADIDVIITYKDGEEPNEKWLPMVRDVNQKQKKPRQYYVKYLEYSWIHAEWVSERWLGSLPKEKTRLKRFLDFCSDENREARLDKRALVWPKSVEDAVPKECVTCEKVLGVTWKKEKGARELGNVDQVLIKWKGCSVVETSWEEVPEEGSERWEDVKKGFEKYLKNEEIAKGWDPQKKNKKFLEYKEQPEWIQGGKLKEYQLEGVNWLLYKWHKENPPILADDMGLGKTLQIVTLISILVEDYGCYPFLIAAPSSTISHWVREFNKWAPSIAVVEYSGNADERAVIREHEIFGDPGKKPKKVPQGKFVRAHVVVTNYELLVRDATAFKGVQWDCLVCDEGHRLKNDSGKTFKTFERSLRVGHKIVLTGTPLQNNIRELFNLMHFLDPKTFTDQSMWEEKYQELDDKLVQELHNELIPYFLRRTKTQVLTDLPPKVEVLVPVSLTALQRNLYKAVLAKNAQLLKSIGISASGRDEARVSTMQNILMELRKICNHPYLLRDVEPEGLSEEETQRRLIDSCGKLHLLHKMLLKFRDRGHRVLIFSQFKLALNFLEDYLNGEGLPVLRLDGETPKEDRQQMIDDFNAPNSKYFVFLLTTRTGGMGINLTSADTIIIYDADWNPHQDLQAMARAHRIGQERAVVVYKLFTRGCVEEKIIEVGKRKLVLDHLIVESMAKTDIDSGELANVIKFGAKALFEEDEASFDKHDIKYDDGGVEKLINRSDILAKHAAEEEEKKLREKEEEKRKEDEKKEKEAAGETVDGVIGAEGREGADGGEAVPAAEKEKEQAKERLGDFSFAKIWNTEKDADEDAAGAQVGGKDEEVGDDFWEKLLRTARVADEEMQVDERGRPIRKVRRDRVWYGNEKKKGKGVVVQQEVNVFEDEEDANPRSSPVREDDEEFVPKGDVVESSDSEAGNSDGEVEVLEDDAATQQPKKKRRKISGIAPVPVIPGAPPGGMVPGVTLPVPLQSQYVHPARGSAIPIVPTLPAAAQSTAIPTPAPLRQPQQATSSRPFLPKQQLPNTPTPKPKPTLAPPFAFISGEDQLLSLQFVPFGTKVTYAGLHDRRIYVVNTHGIIEDSRESYEKRLKDRQALDPVCCWVCFDGLHPLERCSYVSYPGYVGRAREFWKIQYHNMKDQNASTKVLEEIRVKYTLVKLVQRRLEEFKRAVMQGQFNGMPGVGQIYVPAPPTVPSVQQKPPQNGSASGAVQQGGVNSIYHHGRPVSAPAFGPPPSVQALRNQPAQNPTQVGRGIANAGATGPTGFRPQTNVSISSLAAAVQSMNQAVAAMPASTGGWTAGTIGAAAPIRGRPITVAPTWPGAYAYLAQPNPGIYGSVWAAATPTTSTPARPAAPVRPTVRVRPATTGTPAATIPPASAGPATLPRPAASIPSAFATRPTTVVNGSSQVATPGPIVPMTSPLTSGHTATLQTPQTAAPRKVASSTSRTWNYKESPGSLAIQGSQSAPPTRKTQVSAASAQSIPHATPSRPPLSSDPNAELARGGLAALLGEFADEDDDQKEDRESLGGPSAIVDTSSRKRPSVGSSQAEKRDSLASTKPPAAQSQNLLSGVRRLAKKSSQSVVVDLTGSSDPRGKSPAKSLAKAVPSAIAPAFVGLAGSSGLIASAVPIATAGPGNGLDGGGPSASSRREPIIIASPTKTSNTSDHVGDQSAPAATANSNNTAKPIGDSVASPTVVTPVIPPTSSQTAPTISADPTPPMASNIDITKACFFCGSNQHLTLQYFICPVLRKDPVEFGHKVQILKEAGKLTDAQSEDMNKRAMLYVKMSVH
ncbi:hypothetical protein HK097_003915 [Rhizophlyctis rosea]|uniref:Uncharacterized protein n=1 Tax=Rhizophlyctis rosea TaxID=64517 RepID=A0AAD5SHP0_9FUNG|nr:hypothetical protein HK097_003915 [Rhizophlyctis rosea]